MRITPRRCLRNGVIILFIFGLLSCFKVLWRPKVPTLIRKPPSRLQWVQGQPTRKPATQVYSPTHTTEVEDSSPSLLEKSRILILVYTKFWNEERWVGEQRAECFLDYDRKTQCPLEKFEVTYDKKRFAESDLVIFHAAAANMPSLKHLRSLSKNRTSSQRWVYQSMESPMSTPDPEPLNGLFNLTWTYRGDADFSAAYAAYVPLSPEEKLNKMASIMTDFSQGKSELVAWLVSNCQSQLRMSFVRELKKYIKVDVFGSCSRLFGNPRKCSKSYEKHCLKRYKFYLSFENVMCKDYITEKYWGHLGEETNIVPVVMGGADPSDYKRLAIPGSYINVMDFKTVKQLAEYLQYLDKNNTAYNEYFKWRLKYKRSPYHYPLCNFCRSLALKPDLRKPKVYHDLKKYWEGEGMCKMQGILVRYMWS